MIALTLSNHHCRRRRRRRSGLMYLSMNGRQAISSLVESLKTPSRTVQVNRFFQPLPSFTHNFERHQEALLDMLFDIFQIAPAASLKTNTKPNSVFCPSGPFVLLIIIK